MQEVIEKKSIKNIDFNCDLAQAYGVYKNIQEYLFGLLIQQLYFLEYLRLNIPEDTKKFPRILQSFQDFSIRQVFAL